LDATELQFQDDSYLLSSSIKLSVAMIARILEQRRLVNI
jgi:hypothetical protein